MKLAVVAVLVTVTGLGVAHERRISESSLPAAVKAAAARQSFNARVLGYATETEHGKKLYEVSMVKAGKTKDVTMDERGTVIEVEEQVSIEELPSPVREALQAKVGNGKISKVESLQKQDKVVAYEAQVVRWGKRAEVQVGPNGEALARPE
jgi:uncharacterized membrane protein YkoI